MSSTVSTARRLRWLLVVLLVALVAATPVLITAARTAVAGPAPADTPARVLARALAGARQPHQGLFQSEATLGLPDVTGLGDVSSLLGDTNRSQVWWSGPELWRVDTQTSSGENDDYQTGDGLLNWDYESNTLTTIHGDTGPRLPRAVDLLPEQLVTRLLGQPSPHETLTALGDRLVAGQRAAGVRVRPGDPRSTLSEIDVWVRSDGMPVEVRILDQHGRPALTTKYLQLTMGAPSPARLVPPDPVGARQVNTAAPDIAARVSQFGRQPLPGSLAGLASSSPLVAGATTYGRGLVRFVVLPLPPRLAGTVITDARTGGGAPVTLTGGTGVLLSSSALTALTVRSTNGDRSYVLAGLVSADVLRQAAAQLLADPTQHGLFFGRPT